MKSDVLLGVLGGVVVGALLGILLAPEKGADTRENLAEKSDDYLQVLKDKLDAIKEKYESVMGDMNVNGLSKKGSASASGGKSQG